jgi:hypothetical protein
MSKQRNTPPRRQDRPNRRYRRLLPTAFAAAALAAGAGAAPPPLAQAKDQGKATRQMTARSGQAPSIPVRPAVRGR